MSLNELEAAVSQLPANELTAFAQWFEEYLADEWDRRIEADALNGAFEKAGKEAVSEYEAERCKPL